MNDTPPAIWALVDDRAGNRSQCLGVAEVLDFPFTLKEIRYGWLGGLPNCLLGASFAGLTAESRHALAPPWPDIVIGAGRRVAPAARRIKKLSGGRTFIVQLMDPGGQGRDEFDLVAIPRHDRPDPLPNILITTGAPHRLRPETLAAAADAWRPRLAHLPKPWFAVLIGGGAKGRPLGQSFLAELGSLADAMARTAGGSLLVTTSRRTDPTAAKSFLGKLTVPTHVHRWDEGGENPYLGYLALADAVIVTGESMSMCSEACATGAPVYIYARNEFVTPKYARLHAELYESGMARPLREGELFVSSTHPRLNTAEAIAAEIRKRFGTRRT